MSEPCKRHKADKTVDPVFRAVATEDKRHWFIVVWHRCTRCGEQMSGRVLRDTCKPSLSEVLDGYGLSEADKRAYLEQHHPHSVALHQMNQVAKPAEASYPIPPQEGLWPFPCSATHNIDGTRKESRNA